MQKHTSTFDWVNQKGNLEQPLAWAVEEKQTHENLFPYNNSASFETWIYEKKEKLIKWHGFVISRDPEAEKFWSFILHLQLTWHPSSDKIQLRN